MFLDEVSFKSMMNVINCILSWTENHPVTVGVVTAVTAGSLWFYKFISQKRAEALFGFYARLMFLLQSLRTWLDDQNLLEVGKPEMGNIYALIYNNVQRQKACAGFHAPSDKELEDIKGLALQLEKTFTESNNNVYPKSTDRREWYRQQQVLFNFCEFIKYSSMRGYLSQEKDENKKHEHIIKCEELIEAMNFILCSIENELY